jgi:hypothetical protein
LLHAPPPRPRCAPDHSDKEHKNRHIFVVCHPIFKVFIPL